MAGWKITSNLDKEWFLRSPEGAEYRFQNCRSMADYLVQVLDELRRAQLRRHVPDTLFLQIDQIVDKVLVQLRQRWPNLHKNQGREAELAWNIALQLIDRIEIEQ